jgi:hypothetical protein
MNMNASQLFADIDTGCLTEVPAAACSYYDNARGLTVRQSFYVYPDDTVVCLAHCDGSSSTVTLGADDTATFFHLYMQ